MKKKILILGIICMLFNLVIPVYAEDNIKKMTVSKEEVVKLALQQSPELLNMQHDLKVAQAQVDEARAGFFPKVDFNTIYTRLGEKPIISIPIGVDPVTHKIRTIEQERSQNNYSLKLGFQQPLYLGGKLRNGYKQAEKNLRTVELKVEQKKQELRKKVIEEYYRVLKAKKMVELSKQTVDKIKSYVEIAQVNKEVGIFTNTDLLKAKVNLTRAQQRLLTAENGLKLSKLALKNTLGLNNNIILELNDQLDWEEVELEYDQIKEYAFKHRIDLQLLNLQQDILKLNLKSAQGSKYPTISLAGDYSTNGNQLKVSDGDWKINLMLTYNFFDGGAKKSKIKQAVIKVNKFSNTKEQLKTGVELQVRQGLLKLSEAKQSIELMKLSLSEAKENLEQVELKYEEGIVTSFDVLNAQTTFQEVQTNYYQAIYDYNLALARLYKVMGKKVKYKEE